MYMAVLIMDFESLPNCFYSDSEREANLTARKALDLAIRYNFVTELTSLIVVADDNFTLDDGPNGNLGVDESDLTFLAGSIPGRKSKYMI